MYLYCTLRGWIKGTKCALFSIKCKGIIWKKSTVIKLVCSDVQYYLYIDYRNIIVTIVIMI